MAMKSKSELDKIMKLLTDGYTPMESLAMLSYMASCVLIFRFDSDDRGETMHSWMNNIKESITYGLQEREKKARERAQ